MKFTSRLPETVNYSSIRWQESLKVAGVRFAIRRMSLGRRIELTTQVRELALKHEFLRAGDTAEQAEASLADMLARKLYLQWGLDAIEGFNINGQPATAESLVDHGPEDLTSEIFDAIQRELTLSNEERKNY